MNLTDRRLFHLTHVSNLESILRDKQIFADTNTEWDERPAVDISPAEVRARRRSTPSGIPERMISDFVPFSIMPRSSALDLVADTSDFVILVTSLAALVGWQRDFPKAHRPQFLFYDRDPTKPGAQFGRTRTELQTLVQHLEANRFGSLSGVEFLVLGGFPFRLVTSLAVPLAGALPRVQALVADRLEPLATSIKPHWFAELPRPQDRPRYVVSPESRRTPRFE